MPEVLRKSKIFHSDMLPINFRFDSEAETKLQLVPHSQLERFLAGCGDIVAFEDVACRCNFGALMAQKHYTAAEIAPAKEALIALLAMQHRYKTTGKWGVSGDEFTAIKAGLNMTDEIQKNSTRREMRDVLIKMAKGEK